MMRLSVSPRVKFNTLALGLCVLAVLFALETKTAWYSPANGPERDIQSQKALPADLPTVVSRGISARPKMALPLTLSLFAAFAVIAWMQADFFPGIDIDFNHIPVSAAPYFSPCLFFRPPPAL